MLAYCLVMICGLLNRYGSGVILNGERSNGERWNGEREKRSGSRVIFIQNKERERKSCWSFLEASREVVR